MQNVHIEFWQDLRHYCLPPTVVTAYKKSNNDHFHPYFVIIVFKMERSSTNYMACQPSINTNIRPFLCINSAPVGLTRFGPVPFATSLLVEKIIRKWT